MKMNAAGIREQLENARVAPAQLNPAPKTVDSLVETAGRCGLTGSEPFAKRAAAVFLKNLVEPEISNAVSTAERKLSLGLDTTFAVEVTIASHQWIQQVQKAGGEYTEMHAAAAMIALRNRLEAPKSKGGLGFVVATSHDYQPYGGTFHFKLTLPDHA